MNDPERDGRSNNAWINHLRGLWHFIAAVSMDLVMYPLMLARGAIMRLRGSWRFVVAASIDHLLSPLRFVGALKTPAFLVFLFCLPSLLGILLSIGTAIWVARSSRGDIVSEYERTARNAMESNQIDLARWCNRKLLLMEPYDSDPRMALALIADKSGDPARTERLMRQLAPAAGAGYAPAHFWLARKLMGEAPSKDEQQRVRQIKEILRHLRHVVELEPRNVEARDLLGNICARTGQISEAIANLTISAETNPAAHLTLAQLFVAKGDRSLAEMHGKAARDEYQKKLASNPGDIDAELGLAASALFFGDIENAIDVLTKARERTRDTRFDVALTGAYVVAFDRTDPSNVAKRLELIQKAWNYGSDSVAVFARLDALTSGTGNEAQRARQTLERSIEAGRSPGLAHYALAGIAVRNGDFKKALVHAEAAYAALPRVPEMGNNLAYLLSTAEQPDLDRALKLADSAVSIAPDNPNFRETRGQILLKLQRYRDAVTDLELALGMLKDMPGIHAGLADAYEHLGDRELAARHRELAAAGTTPKP